MNTKLLEVLLADLDEELATGGFVALYEVSWILAGLGVDRSDPTFAPLAREAYVRFRAGHPDLVLAYGTWPHLLATATRAPDEVEIDLDPKTTSDRDTPILLLTHPDELAPARDSSP